MNYKPWHSVNSILTQSHQAFTKFINSFVHKVISRGTSEPNQVFLCVTLCLSALRVKNSLHFNTKSPSIHQVQ